MEKQYLIIGLSAAGLAAAHKARACDPTARIICIEKKTERPTNTCLAAEFLAQALPEEKLFLKPESFFDDLAITVLWGHEVVSLDRTAQTVRCANGVTIHYTTLCIATGTTPFTLPDQHAYTNVFSFHHTSDAKALMQYLETTERPAQHALIVGAGLSGIECADALVRRGLTVTLLEGGEHLLPTLVTRGAAQHIALSMTTGYPVTYLPRKRVHRIRFNAGDSSYASGLETTDGNRYEADLIVITIGAQPATTFAGEAGLTLAHGCIAVNRRMQSSDRKIYAAGDSAAVPALNNPDTHLRTTTWPDAVQQGLIAGTNMASSITAQRVYGGLLTATSSTFFGTRFVSCGLVHNLPVEMHVSEYITAASYRTLITDTSGILRGFVFTGTLSNIGLLRNAVATQQKLSDEDRQRFLSE